jgi:ubiquinone/menaquinone biosynthesis C-methylase UbiE
MTTPQQPAPAGVRGPYLLEGNRAFEQQLALRTAARDAAFFLPYLRPGLRLLDVGCGPGSITTGVAAAVAPGVTVGIDLQPVQVVQAQATTRTAATLRFACADAYHLPFLDSSFDAVFAHAVVMHLREPVRALAELRRVLRPDGVIGLRDPDGGTIFVPETPVLAQWRTLAERVRQHHGTSLYRGRQHRRLLREAGFARTAAAATLTSTGTLAETRQSAAFFTAQWQGLARTALAQGWVDTAQVAAIAAELEAWAERPDAFSTSVWCTTVGWVSV